MLSKIRYSGSVIRSFSDLQSEDLTFGLKAFFGIELSGIRPAQGGTLSVCFKADLNSQCRFFKTHAVPSGFCTLPREDMFLKATAAEQTDPHLLYLAEGESKRAWLHTRLLDPCGSPSPSEVLSLIADFDAKLQKNLKLADLVPTTDSIHQLLCHAETAFICLASMGLLSSKTTERVRFGINRLKVVCTDIPLKLCHGDLGPANIMNVNDSLVALDWEDAFWGIAGYDYLYWLTFFGNRRWLSANYLGFTTLERSNEISLMLVILLLKSWISVRNGSHSKNSITIDHRLLEVMALE